MSPVHIQPNVTISGRIYSSYQEHQIASPWGCFTVLFADFGVGACTLQRIDTQALNSVQITYRGAYLLGKHSNNT